MGKVFITGDTHGDFLRIQEFCRKNNTTQKDIMIILGDAGINYYKGKRDIFLKERLKELPITLFCIHGNHECRPETIDTYEEKNFLGGRVYYEKQYPNLIFAKDGEIYDFLGHKTLVIGGAYSVDKYYRLSMGYSWFKDEQPSEEIKQKVEETLKNNDYKVDIVLSHTCPLNAEPRHLFLSMIDQSTVDKSTEIWMQEIANKLDFNHWYYGHFHGEWTFDKYRLFFNDYMELTEKRDRNG